MNAIDAAPTPTTRPPAMLGGARSDPARRAEEAGQLKEAFTQFIGETFFGQMLKAMRSTVGEPAYFHGGAAERQFQARLDQQIAQDLGSSGGGGYADELFRAQFPAEARLLDEQPSPSLAQLDGLRRR